MSKDYYGGDLKRYGQLKKEIILDKPNHPLFIENYYIQLSYRYNLYNDILYNAWERVNNNSDLVRGFENMII